MSPLAKPVGGPYPGGGAIPSLPILSRYFVKPRIAAGESSAHRPPRVEEVAPLLVNDREPLAPPARDDVRAPRPHLAVRPAHRQPLRRRHVVVPRPVGAGVRLAPRVEELFVVVEERHVKGARQIVQPPPRKAAPPHRRVEVVEVDLPRVAPREVGEVGKERAEVGDPHIAAVDDVGGLSRRDERLELRRVLPSRRPAHLDGDLRVLPLEVVDEPFDHRPVHVGGHDPHQVLAPIVRRRVFAPPAKQRQPTEERQPTEGPKPHFKTTVREFRS